MNTKTTAILVALCASTSISAQETRQHDSHAHGMGELNIITEGNELIIEFISPSANIVGFEHAPSTSEQTAAVNQAEASLRQAENLFETSKQAVCELEHANIESALLSEQSTHADEDGHDEHEEHADEDGHDEHEDETHSEFHAHYEFHCAEIEQLTEINVNVFSVFPLTESLNVQLLSTSVQSQVTLDKDNTIVEL